MAETGNDTRIRIDPQESLPDVLTRLRSVPGGPVVLQIPDHCPLLLTAAEFRALKQVADQQHLQLSLGTTDRLRLQLASMFGLAAADGSPAPPVTNGGPTPAPGVWSPGGWRTGQPRSGPESGGSTGAGNGGEPPDPIAVSRRRRTELYEPEFAGQTRPGSLAGQGKGSLDYLDEEDKPSRLNARLAGRLVAVTLVLVAILLFAAWFYMPGVTVTLALRQQPLNASLIYSVAASGAVVSNDSAFSAPATHAESGVDFTVTAKATGVKKEPDKTAAGAVELRNPGSKSVKVPQGTRLTTLAGGGYATLDEVEVPAAKGKQPGEATVQVTATDPGTAGNLPQGYLTGKLDKLRVFYSNRSAAIAGGTDRSIAIVTKDDIKKNEDLTRDHLNEIVADAWQKQLPPGTMLVASSVAAGTPVITVEQQAGDQSETVVLHGTVKATGLTFTKADVERQARAAVAKQMDGQVPEGFELDPASIQLGQAQMIAESPDSAQFSLTATGAARAVFDQGQQTALRDRLAGKSMGEVDAIMKSVGAIKNARVEIRPGWWSHRMPQSAGRINIHVAASETSAPQPATTPATPAVNR